MTSLKENLTAEQIDAKLIELEKARAALENMDMPGKNECIADLERRKRELIIGRPRDKFKYNDGGRSKHFKGHSGDCATRAIAIATGQHYWKIWQDISYYKKLMNKNSKSALHSTPTVLAAKLLTALKWESHVVEPGTLFFDADNFMEGRFVVFIPRHMAAVIDGVIHDTFDSSNKTKKRQPVQVYFTPPGAVRKAETYSICYTTPEQFLNVEQ